MGDHERGVASSSEAGNVFPREGDGVTSRQNAEGDLVLSSGKPSSPGLDPLHCLTHFPKDSRCDICSQCKLQNSPHRKKKKPPDGDSDSRIDSEKFGDIITAYHIILGSECDFSRHGDTAAMGCQDHYTQWIAGYPAPRKTAE